jgi:hypothetical protein
LDAYAIVHQVKSSGPFADTFPEAAASSAPAISLASRQLCNAMNSYLEVGPNLTKLDIAGQRKSIKQRSASCFISMSSFQELRIGNEKRVRGCNPADPAGVLSAPDFFPHRDCFGIMISYALNG